MVRSFATIVASSLLACASESSESDCVKVVVGSTHNEPGALTSGRDRFAAAWQLHHAGPLAWEVHAKVLDADGNAGPEISTYTRAHAVLGDGSTLWLDPSWRTCPTPQPWEVTLERGGDVASFRIEATTSRAAIFDGTAYQLLWSDGARLYRRTLRSSGALSSIDTLFEAAAPIDCFSLASDDNGMVIVRVDRDVYRLDGASLRLVYTFEPLTAPEEPFYMDGAFHARDRFLLYTFDLDGGATARALPEIPGLQTLPGTTKLFLVVSNVVHELDASLSIARSYSRQDPYPVATVGDQLVRMERLDADGDQPGRIVYIVGDEVRDLAVDVPRVVCE